MGAVQATAGVPERILFRQKKPTKGQPTSDASVVVDLRITWLELLPYEVRHINGKLTVRGASWLERIRLQAEHDVMHIGHLDEWKALNEKGRRALEYCSITGFDRILAVNLLRKNFMKLTPAANYVRESSPARLHHLIMRVSTVNRYRLSPIGPKKRIRLF